MTTFGHNSDRYAVYLTEAQAKFLIGSCHTNIGYGLEAIQALKSEDLLQQMVNLIENFKAIKDATEEALK